MYFTFCVIMKQPEKIFLESRFCKITKMIDYYLELKQKEYSAARNETPNVDFYNLPKVSSLKDIKGFI